MMRIIQSKSIEGQKNKQQQIERVCKMILKNKRIVYLSNVRGNNVMKMEAIP